MRVWSQLVGGVVLLGIGLVWALQGAGVLGGSGMSGQVLWLVIGLVAAAVGGFLLFDAVKRRGHRA